MNSKLKIGTRGSDLALWQANEVARLVPAETEIVIIKTSGDKFQDISLQTGQAQGYFTKEIEERLIVGEIDAAVHSLKDLPTAMPPGLTLGAILKRAPVSDLLLIHPDWHDQNADCPVKTGCNTGAMSLRRQALLKLFAPQAVPVAIRGNVPGRIERCIKGEFGAIILARAGVERLNLLTTKLMIYELNPELWPPAPGQGAVAVEARESDSGTRKLLAAINDEQTKAAVELERKVLANFEGGCHTAFGAWAENSGGDWTLRIGIEDGGVWKQAIAHSEYSELMKIGPASALEFRVPEKSGGDILCKPLKP